MGYFSHIITKPKHENELFIEYNEPVIHQATQNFVYTEVNEVTYFNVEKPEENQATINYENNFINFNKI